MMQSYTSQAWVQQPTHQSWMFLKGSKAVRHPQSKLHQLEGLCHPTSADSWATALGAGLFLFLFPSLFPNMGFLRHAPSSSIGQARALQIPLPPGYCQPFQHYIYPEPCSHTVQAMDRIGLLIRPNSAEVVVLPACMARPHLGKESALIIIKLAHCSI